MADMKKTLAGLAIVGVLGVTVYEGTEPVVPQDKVIQNEEVSLRTANAAVIKTKVKNQYTAHIYSAPIHYKAEDGSFKTIDISIQEKAFLNKLGGYEYEVASGVYNAEFPKEKQYNYKFTRGGASVGFEAEFDTTASVEIAVQPTPQGIKEIITLKDDKAPPSLSWKLAVDGAITGDGEKGWTVWNEQAGRAFIILPFTAYDAKMNPVKIMGNYDSKTEKVTAILDVKNTVYPIIIDPTVTIEAADNISGTIYSQTTANYATARSTGNGTDTNPASWRMDIGQRYVVGSTTYLVRRSFMSFALPMMASCLACTLYADGNSDASVVDFDVQIYGAAAYKSTITTADFTSFDGYQNGSAYNGTRLNEVWNTASYSSGWNKIIFNADGRASAFAAQNDTLWIAAVSSRDSANTIDTAGNYEDVFFEGYTAYLSLSFTVPTINAPTGFQMIPINEGDSLKIIWDKTFSDDITELKLYTWPDSNLVATLDKTASEARIGGLNPYQNYSWYIRADSLGVYGYSNHDASYTLQTFKTENFLFKNYGNNQNANTAVYDSARAETLADSLSNGSTYLGQQKSGADYYVFRHYQNISLPKLTKVLAETLVVKGIEDHSTTDFNIVVRMGKWATATAAKLKYYLFDGWQAGMAAYTGIAGGSFSTSGFAVGDNKITLKTDFHDSTETWGAIPDSLRFLLLSSKDVSATAPTGDEYVTINPLTSYLKLTYAPPDSAPTGFTLTAISPDSLLAEWTDRSYSERGFLVYDLDTGLKVAGTDTTLNDVTSLRIGGLSVNTKYRFKVRAIGGGCPSDFSAPDSCYTNANVPAAPTISFPAGNMLKFIINENSNPAYTPFAVQDSITGLYVDFISGAIDTFKASPVWRKKSDWGGTNGDTVEVLVGKKYVLRVKAKSGQ